MVVASKKFLSCLFVLNSMSNYLSARMKKKNILLALNSFPQNLEHMSFFRMSALKISLSGMGDSRALARQILTKFVQSSGLETNTK